LNPGGIITRSQARSGSLHDTVIRGGTIVDGTGKSSFTGDVAISADASPRSVASRGLAGARSTPKGLLVTPGWVDVHTHYDGQAMWDPPLGAVMLARRHHGSVRQLRRRLRAGEKHHRGELMDLMEGVEEIPNPVLCRGLTWEWETFPEFMDALERRPRAIDIAAQAAHLPAARLCDGRPRGAARSSDARRHRRNAPSHPSRRLKSGAFGFTTSRTDSHKTPRRRIVASRDADADELVGIGSALGARRHGRLSA